ncbi:unnamed protein product [Cyprideis torosa]|uniref:Uncharacterized protein n=1 Tax=Cyprideis torosa TaxID=163714 RepID=A0A7R8WX56_9CRUS|nr:unnamed protein product [Cyprideis torosa]CAG0911990.1 unnamed protein product [Cyprideis torosa]
MCGTIMRSKTASLKEPSTSLSVNLISASALFPLTKINRSLSTAALAIAQLLLVGC